MSKKPYGLTKPCDNCPFRNDIPAFLTKGRVREIERALDRGEFECHKTTFSTGGEFDEDGHYNRSGKEAHCAGALILLEKLERPSQMMRISERLGMYDRTKLDMDAPVFDTFKEMIAAQEADRPRRKRAR